MKRSESYKSAKLHSPRDGVWYLEWYNLNPASGQLTRIRRTFDLNREPNLQHRMNKAVSLQSAINISLANGWNFFDEGNEWAPKAQTLEQALDECLKITLMNLGLQAVRSYSSILNVFKKWLNEKDLLNIRPGEFKAKHLLAYIESRAGNSPSNINAHILLIRQLFEKMKKVLAVIAVNPAENITLVKVPETNRFETLTSAELSEISNFLRTSNEIGFLLYTQFILYAFIRPGHIAGIRRSQIDFNANTIKIHGNETKGKRNTTKQLLAPLKETMLMLDIDKLPPDWYIIGKDFAPAPEKFPTLDRRAQARWKAMTGEMGIKKHLYSLKHTGAQMYIENNAQVDVSWLQNQMEHSTLAETETYIRKRKSKMLDESSLNLPKF